MWGERCTREEMANICTGTTALLAQEVSSIVLIFRVFRFLALQRACASCVWARVITSDLEVGNVFGWLLKKGAACVDWEVAA